MNFGPKNADEELLFAQEGIRVDAQYLIQKALNKSGISNFELAKKMSRSEKYINHLFDCRREHNIRELAEIFHYLGYEMKISIEEKK